MKNTQRIQQIEEQLNQAFTPGYLKVMDESHHHVGHPGAKDGCGHFAIEIAASAFEDKKAIECHRMIYAALGDLMKTDIHALRIKVVASDSSSSNST